MCCWCRLFVVLLGYFIGLFVLCWVVGLFLGGISGVLYGVIGIRGWGLGYV